MEQERQAQALHRVGSVVADRYEIIDLRGVGGMGAVYGARHLFTGDLVALKLLYPDLANQRDASERFAREARAPASINHPNICRVLDAGTEASTGERYIAMELLEGTDLSVAIERGGVELSALLDVSLQILDALSAAHARGFVHRDIKPENIFLSPLPDGRHRARLLDFGVARRPGHEPSRMTEPGHVVGTVWYMSPEQARGGAEVDHRADLWAFGAVLFHALAGRPPFDGDNHNQLLRHRHRCGALAGRVPLRPAERPRRPHRPRARPALEARWQTAREMHRALGAVLESLDGAPIRVQTNLRRERTRDLWLTPSPSPSMLPPPSPASPSREMLRGAVIAAFGLVAILAVAAMLPRNTARATTAGASLWQSAPIAAPARLSAAPLRAAPQTPTVQRLAPPSRRARPRATPVAHAAPVAHVAPAAPAHRVPARAVTRPPAAVAHVAPAAPRPAPAAAPVARPLRVNGAAGSASFDQE
ncbi:MAG: serine/threonine-protein kinase [Polyangiales bacterium]